MNFVRSRKWLEGPSTAPMPLAEADAARDGLRWPEAVRGYRRYLASSPEDAAIWVQLGHALKETGDLESALDAYERGLQRAPSDSDARLHRAHLLKRMNRFGEAGAAFLELMASAPTREVMDELRALSLGPRAEAMAAAISASPCRSTFIEIEDLLSHLERHATLTGISRVVLGLVHHALESTDDAASPHRFVSQGDCGDRLFLVSRDAMRRVVRAVAASLQDRAALTASIVEARRSAQPVTLARGDTYLIPGAFWLACTDPNLFPRLRRDGVLIAAYIYDLIPITHARYCEASMTRTFTVALGEALPFLDVCLTISSYVAGELGRFLSSNGMPSIPIRPVPLPHEMRLGPEPRRTVPHHRVEEVLGRPFVLCVCTIEARKNHAYLLAVWHRMIDDGMDPPDLVFVGRIGWRAGDLFAQADASRHLDGRLHILQGVSDADLASLYEGCLFTVFPSFVEGWGLPVGESLSHGKVCAASSATSIPEVGGELCVYFDPSNVASGREAIGGLLADPARLAAGEAALRSAFRPRTWRDLGRDFFAALDALTAGLDPDGRPEFVPSLRPGALVTMRHLVGAGMDRADYVLNPLRLLFSAGWRRAEASGTWLAEPRARLVFRTEYSEGRDIAVLLHVSTSPWVTSANRLRVRAAGTLSRKAGADDGREVAIPLDKNAARWIRVKGRVGADGVAAVHLAVEGPDIRAEGENLPVAVRLHALGYAALDDVAARMDLLESRELSAP